MKYKNNPMVIFIALLVGAAIQNIVWYIRLQSPTLLKEFEMYWAADGARLFLDFNTMNYFFIFISIIIYVIFKLFAKKNK